MIAWVLFMAVEINLRDYLNPHYRNLYQSTDRELLIYGGAGAGKSYAIADRILSLACLWDFPCKTLLVRKTLASIKQTSWEFLKSRAEEMGLPYQVNLSNYTAQCNNMRILCRGMNNQEDYQKVKSLTDIDIIWVNELTELRESDYTELLLRLRGRARDHEYHFRQIVSDFNPIGKTSWVYKRFFQQNIGCAVKYRYTVYDNPWAEPEYIKALEASKQWDQNYYKIYFEGEWGELEGIVFDWDVVPLPNPDPDWYDEIGYGGDFGFSVDPAALVRVYRKADEYWFEQVIYNTGLTNQALADRMDKLGIDPNAEQVWDSAEPKSIQELCDRGYNCRGSRKGKDSIRHGTDFVKSLKCHIVDGSEDVIREQKSYVYKKDKNGESLNVPIEHNDHAMRAIVYYLYTKYGQGTSPQEVKTVDISGWA